MQHEPLKLDTLVELQDQYSKVYPLSPTGARGWVRARREMPKMDPEVYIEWDKTHWRYHGERDGWTFEHHFRPVDDALELTADQIPRLSGAPHHADPGIEKDRPSRYIDALMEAQEAALGADGFFTITITPRREGGLTIYEPVLHTETLTDRARDVLDAQLVDIAAQLLARHLLDQVDGLEGRDELGR